MKNLSGDIYVAADGRADNRATLERAKLGDYRVHRSRLP